MESNESTTSPLLCTPLPRPTASSFCSLTPLQLRFSPTPVLSRHIFLTTPGLKGDLPGSVECTPELLRTLVSPPPGFEGKELSPDELQFSSTTRRLEYLDSQEESGKLAKAVREYVGRTEGLTLESPVRRLMESLEGTWNCGLFAASTQTDEDLLQTELTARLEDIGSLRSHITSITTAHSEALQSLHSSYTARMLQLQTQTSQTTAQLQIQLTAAQAKLRNATALLSTTGLDSSTDLSICVNCETLTSKLAAVSDQLAISQDYIRKKALGEQSCLYEVKGRELRTAVHRQVVLVEELLPSTESETLKEEFLKLPYLLKPLFDLLRDYERLLAGPKPSK